MADIDIQRKEGMAWMWWVLGLVILGLLAWFLLSRGGTDQTAVDTRATGEPAAAVAPEPMAPATDASLAASPAITEYMSACAPATPQAMGLNHTETSACIRRLADSVEEISRRPNVTGVAVNTELQTARDAANRLQQSPPDATDHSAMAREGLTSLATAISRVQPQTAPNMTQQANRLQQTAQSVSPTASLLDQRTEVQNFFREAGEVLQGMAGAR